MEKKSKLLYKELKELEKKFLPFKLINAEAAVGLTVKAVHTISNLWDYKDGVLVVFEKGKALFCYDGSVDTCPILIRSYYSNFINRKGEIIGPEAWMTNFSKWMYSLRYANTEIGEQMIAKAKEWEQALNDESLYEEIQKKAAELKALTDKLK